MNKKKVKGATLGLTVGAGLTGGLWLGLHAGESTPSEVVEACAGSIGKVSLVDALYDNEKCGKYAHKFSISPVSTVLNGARQTVVIDGPSKAEFLNEELPKAQDSERNEDIEGGIFVATIPFLYAAVGAWAGSSLAKDRESRLSLDTVAEAV